MDGARRRLSSVVVGWIFEVVRFLRLFHASIGDRSGSGCQGTSPSPVINLIRLVTNDVKETRTLAVTGRNWDASSSCSLCVCVCVDAGLGVLNLCTRLT